MAQDSGHTFATESIPFKPLADGVEMRVVHIDDEAQSWTIMIHANTDSVLPRHKHLFAAEIYILNRAGDHPQTGAFHTGDYILEPPGAIHDPLVHSEEVLLIMRSAGPVDFLADDGSTAFTMDAAMLRGFQKA